MNVLSGRGMGFQAEGRAAPFLPCLPLPHPPPTSHIRVSENHVQNAPLAPCISDPLQGLTRCLARVSTVGSGEFSAETLRTKTPGVSCHLSSGVGCFSPLLASCYTCRTQDWNYRLLNLLHGLLLLQAIKLETLRFS